MHLPSLRSTIFVSVVSSLLILSACNKPTQTALPQGTQTVTGALMPAELSLNRRGTHLLSLNGQDVYYVESSTVNLRNFEGQDVAVTGLFELNSDPAAFPVLVATKIVSVESPSHPWTVPALNLRLSAPLTWNADIFDDGIIFSQTGSTVSLLKIHKSSLAQLPTGTPLVVGGLRASRVTTASGVVIYVQNSKDILAINVDKSLVDVQKSDLAQDALRVVRSISFTNVSSSSSSAFPTGTGSVTGTPCGGAAGVLCPTGSYCQITDTAAGIGVCRSLSN